MLVCCGIIVNGNYITLLSPSINELNIVIHRINKNTPCK